MADTAEPLGQSGPVLTKQQIKILLAIRNLARDHDGRPPSMREVARALGRKSAGGLGYQYAILEATGFLRRESGGVRTVQVRLPGEPSFLAQYGETAPRPAPGSEAGDTPAGPGRETVVWVPVAGQVAAGEPISPAEPREDRLPLPREMVGAGALFALRVVGDSMIGVGIVDGDWVVIREQAEAENGEVVAALIDGIEVEGTVKTLKLADGHRWLMPQNPAYTPILGDQAEIRGKVVAVLRSV
jgi:repressor LexA